MILKHLHFEILQKTVLERVFFNPPFKADATIMVDIQNPAI